MGPTVLGNPHPYLKCGAYVAASALQRTGPPTAPMLNMAAHGMAWRRAPKRLATLLFSLPSLWRGPFQLCPAPQDTKTLSAVA